jgi:hypothetical protein
MGIDDWFLTAVERGNPAFRLPPWSAGNRVVAHVHGSAYFARLVEEVRALRPGTAPRSASWSATALASSPRHSMPSWPARGSTP